MFGFIRINGSTGPLVTFQQTHILFFFFTRDCLMVILMQRWKNLFHPALKPDPDSLLPDIIGNLIKVLGVTVLCHFILGGLECFLLLPCSKSFSSHTTYKFKFLFSFYILQRKKKTVKMARQDVCSQYLKFFKKSLSRVMNNQNEIK